MKIIYNDIKKGVVKLKVENLDDLWYLSGILNRGDKVVSKTERRVKSKDGSIRDKSVREVITLGIEIESIALESAEMLRVSGRIIEGPEDMVAKGSYHTFNIQKDSVLKITKERWSNVELQRLRDAEKSSLRPKILITILEEGEVTIALLRDSKVFYYDMSKSIGGKYDTKGRKERKDEFYREIADFLKDVKEKENVSAVIISGPGFEPENFYKFLLERYSDMGEKTFFERGCSAGRSGVNEIIKKPSVGKILEKVNSAEEIKNMNRILEEIGKGSGLGIYGSKEIENAAELGAIELLLVNDDFFINNRDSTERIIQNVKNKSGQFKFVNHESESGQQLDAIGGIAAILRFKM